MQNWDTRIKNLKTDIEIARQKYVVPFIKAETKAPFIETFTIQTGDFQPYTSYQVRIERLGPSSGINGDYDHSSPCILQTVEHIIDDKLRYPYAAYSSLIFDAESFAKIPRTGYMLQTVSDRTT